MRFSKNILLTSAISMAIAGNAFAEDSHEFTLGKITVGSEQTQKIEASIVDAEEMQNQGLVDVGEAIARTPGVTFDDAGGRRAESKVQIRGFGSTRITVNVDGIPVYMPYDGNIDLSRYLTGELKSIEVQKSLGSLLLGPNNMGGSINLVTKKPTKELEGSVSAGVETGKNGIFANFLSAQVGSKLSDKFFVSGGISRVDRNNFPLSDDFKPQTHTSEGMVQPKGDRVRSKSENTNANIKFGFTPNATDEYVIGYQDIRGSKEAPLDASENGNVAYWDWPVWDKQSTYFLSHTQFGETYLKTRLYLDKFQNRLNGWDDDTHTTITKNQGKYMRSQYDDQSYGGNIEVGRQVGIHGLRGTFHAKIDQHNERNLKKDNSPANFDERWKKYETEIFSLGVEDRMTLNDKTALTLGYRLDQHQVTKTDDNDPNTRPTNKNDAHNFQIKAEHQLTEQHLLFGGISQKTRFPSPKDMVSYRMGSHIPNPDLGAEKALHYEIGSLGKFGKIDYQASLFYSAISDAIESVKVNANESQNQNVGDATHYGAEVGVNIPTTDNTRLDLSYTYLHKELADKSLKATGSPTNQAMASFNYFPTDKLDLIADLWLTSGRYMSTDGKDKVSGYGLVNLRANYQINQTFSGNLALKNALDKDYELNRGQPMQGRSLWLGVNAKL